MAWIMACHCLANFPAWMERIRRRVRLCGGTEFEENVREKADLKDRFSGFLLKNGKGGFDAAFDAGDGKSEIDRGPLHRG